MLQPINAKIKVYCCTYRQLQKALNYHRKALGVGVNLKSPREVLSAEYERVTGWKVHCIDTDQPSPLNPNVGRTALLVE